MTVEIPKEKYSGSVRLVTIGAAADEGGTRARTLTIGGETSMPFMHHEGEAPNRPALALEIRDRKPDDWSPLLVEAWGDVIDDPVTWAKATETAGADLIYLRLSPTTGDGEPNTADQAKTVVRQVLEASGLPLAGDRMLLVDIIKILASAWASRERGM